MSEGGITAEDLTGERFTLPDNSVARERLNGITQLVDEIKQGHPEILSFCMYGSMVYGKAKESSDIDGRLFIDGEIVPQKVFLARPGGLMAKAVNRLTGLNRGLLKSEASFRDGGVRKEYEAIFTDELQNRLHLDRAQVGDIMIAPLSRKIIDAYVDDMSKGTQPNRSLGIMFNLAIGHGVEKYRRYLLDKLATLGSRGEEMWKGILSDIMFREHPANMHFSEAASREKLYPQTVEEAKRVYLEL